jgi:hypothetical protein
MSPGRQIATIRFGPGLAAAQESPAPDGSQTGRVAADPLHCRQQVAVKSNSAPPPALGAGGRPPNGTAIGDWNPWGVTMDGAANGAGGPRLTLGARAQSLVEGYATRLRYSACRPVRRPDAHAAGLLTVAVQAI